MSLSKCYSSGDRWWSVWWHSTLVDVWGCSLNEKRFDNLIIAVVEITFRWVTVVIAWFGRYVMYVSQSSLWTSPIM